MKPEDLQVYSPNEDMLKNDLGVGVVTVYRLKNGMSYLVMGEYHNKGALSPTVGARFNQEQTFYDVIKDAFHRKRLGELHFESGEIDEGNIYFSTNAKQKLARLAFVQYVYSDLTEDQFREKHIAPMHAEAQRQRYVSNFFWRLDETLNPSKQESKFKFKSNDELSQAAKNALENISKAHFPVSLKITEKLIAMQDSKYTWNEDISPLAFYEKNGGRKYSELTGFYLMPLVDILAQLKNPKIKSGKTDQDKSTVFIDHSSLPKEEKWKKFFIFEDEIKIFAEIMYQLTAATSSSTTTFKPTFLSKEIEELENPWIVEKINFNAFNKLDASKKLSSTL